MDVIPGINVNTKHELLEKIQQVNGVRTLHIDVTDNKFAKKKTIQSSEINSLKKTPRLQVHYMGYHPLKEFEKYKKIDEFIFHVETENSIIKAIKEIKSKNVKAGIAFNPETQIKNYTEEIKNADLALVMTVHPGPSGQKMILSELKKIAQIRKINKKIKVGIDGGVNKSTINSVRSNFAVVASAVFSAEDPKRALEDLSKA